MDLGRPDSGGAFAQFEPDTLGITRDDPAGRPVAEERPKSGRPPREPGHSGVRRVFVAPAPNRCWVADFMHVAAWVGTVYVAFVIDTFSRPIVGWAAGPPQPGARRA
ncbi:DDE-type integrase/transposase/recombinase [Streptomyces mirabilis]|uniref:DDE-type integrase/transposase/recombinase n=1 Tax=Streptomyces mirabilis TaxID=68239 RepID=UPI0015D579CF